MSLIEHYLSQWVNLEKTGEFKYGRTLTRIQCLLSLLNDPQKSGFRVITVAGSKGKGSTASMIASILTQSGLCVGLYLSPHVEQWNERIQINQKYINDVEAMSLIKEIDPIIQSMNTKPTYFEIVTAMALLYFKNKGVEVAVLEVGLGGKWDATNICDADIGVITPIGYEHQAVLGNTLKAIAEEKSGIIKPDCHVVMTSQNDEAEQVIQQKAKDLNARIVAAAPWKKELHITLPLLGDHQMQNAHTAYTTTKLYGKIFSHPILSDHVRKGLEELFLPGRSEIFDRNPIWFMDGAHNAESAECLARTIQSCWKDKPIHMLIGMFRDKKPKNFLKAFNDLNIKNAFAVPIRSHRSFSASELQNQMMDSYPMAQGFESLEKAIQCIQDECKEQDLILVTGSFYLIGEVKSYLNTHQMSAT